MKNNSKAFIIIIYILFCFLGSKTNFSDNKVTFKIKYKNEISQYKTNAIFVLPNQVIRYEVIPVKSNAQFVIQTKAGIVKTNSSKKWEWTAPKGTGIYSILIKRKENNEKVLFNAFVMIPYSQVKSSYLNHYKIGVYPQVKFNNPDIYQPPAGFIEVTKENKDTAVSTHFTLNEFICKQASPYPKYVFIKERLILKLEILLEEVNQRGIPCTGFFIMSAYRSPYYNQSIGNVKYSRHVYGGAADIFIDEDNNSNMDDLNKDGRIDYKDSQVLYGIIDELYLQTFYKPFVGGLGQYEATKRHGPFVHVDVRGFRARWGD